MSKNHFYLLLLILGTAFWGISFSFVKVAVDQGSPYVFLFYKFLLATLALSLIFIKEFKKINLQTLKLGAMFSIPLLLGTVFQTIGLETTSVTNSAFLTGLDVILIPIFKWSLFGKRVQKKMIFSCSLAAFGLYLIVVKDTLHLVPGDLWTLACAGCFAIYVLLVGRYSKVSDPIPTVITMLAICAIGCLIMGGALEVTEWLPRSYSFWKAAFFVGILATAYMYTIQNIAQKYIQEEKVALAYLCEPVFAAATGLIFLGEKLSANVIAGAILIMMALLIAEVRFSREG